MYQILSAFLALTLMSLPAANLAAQQLDIGDSVAMNDSLAQLKAKLTPYCGQIKLNHVATPSYPLAGNSEHQLLCLAYEKAGTDFAKAAFTLADGRFVQMEAIGVDTDKFESLFAAPMMNYLGMDVFDKGTVWLDKSGRRLIWMAKAALHPNLFAWHNPILDSSKKPHKKSTSRLPPFVDFKLTLGELRPQIKRHCQQIEENISKSVWLPNKPKQQIQVNCFGFDYAGFERKFELVFGDGKLEVIWVLTAKPEEERVRRILISDWGKPDQVNADWEVFSGGRISLRKDKPELLILSDEMIPLYQAKFNSQSTP